MKDELIDLLRDRFSGHELEVPDTVWENVSGQLAASASGEGLRKALQDKFQAHEVDVDPIAWSNISSQLGHGAAAGTSFSMAWIAAGIAAVAITAGVLLWHAQETPAPVVTAPIETVTQQPIAALTPVPNTTPEAVTPAGVVAAKPEAEAVKTSSSRSSGKAAQKQVTPVVAQQQAQPSPEPAKAEVKDATQPVVKATTSGNASAAPIPQTVATKPQVPSPQKTDPTVLVAPGPTLGNSYTPTPVDPKEPATQPPTPPAPSASDSPNGDDPFKTDAFNMFFPNTFTPNGDGDNDAFGIIVGPHLNALIQIFSMNGSLVFQTNDPTQWWNGHLPNGNIADEGSYICIVQIVDLEGTSHFKKKVISLYR